jgi:hypothetical protein
MLTSVIINTMKKVFILCILIFFPAFVLKSSEKKYPVSEIHSELLKEAKAIVRIEEAFLTVLSPDEATLKVKHAITILNDNGIRESYLIVPYNKFYTIRKIEGVIYNASGEKEKRIPREEIFDFSAGSGYSIYEDTRIKYINPNYRNFPFTVEYTFEISMNGMINYPDWNLYNDYNISVEKASLEISLPKNMSIRFKKVNYDGEPAVSESEGARIYRWESSNLKALRPDPYGLPFAEYIPRIIVTPEKFKMEGYEGTSKTWNEIGFWNLKLQEGRTVLPPETVAKVKDLVSSATNDAEKVGILYEYMQEKVRYVSIQIGIGGYQPFPAETVDRLSYGDCKALSLYMKSLLEVVGVKSNYTLVMAGQDAERTDLGFPDMSFNHVILFVPLPNDTIWLECTSQSLPAGYLGSFTDDRNALAVTDLGGEIVHTPIYSEKENYQLRQVDLKIVAEGNALAQIKTKSSGIFYDREQRYLRMDEKDRKKAMYDHVDIPTFDLYSITMDESKTRIPVVLEKLELGIPNFAARMGERMIFEVNLMNKMKRLPVSTAERKSEVFIRRSTAETDSIFYTFPDGYICEKPPAPVTISSQFGSYSAEMIATPQGICYVRKLNFTKGTFPPADYPRLVEYIEKIIRADAQKIVLTKKV